MRGGEGGDGSGGGGGWRSTTLLLCAFGLLREIRPSEPYVSEFLLGEWRELSAVQLTQQVYPIGTYSYLAQLILVFLLTDYLRFKPIIILSGICGISVYAILLWTSSLAWLQASQFFYGLYMATEVAYFTYIFAKVETNKYARVSSYTRMAALTGRSISGTLAQLLTYFALMDYRQLNYITFIAQILATFWAIWLPRVKYSVYFHRNDPSLSTAQTDITSMQPSETVDTEKEGCSAQFVEASSLIAHHARSAYKRGKVIRWSALYAASICLYYQAQYYVQILWRDIDPHIDVAWNGAVEAVLTLLGAGAAYLTSRVTHGIIPGVLAGVQGLALFSATYPSNIYVSYLGYVIVGVAFHYTITLASTKIASELSDESCFGLIFGINTLIGTGLQSVLTFVMISDSSLGLSIQQQFYTISGCYAVLAACWIVCWAFNAIRAPERNNTEAV